MRHLRFGNGLRTGAGARRLTPTRLFTICTGALGMTVASEQASAHPLPGGHVGVEELVVMAQRRPEHPHDVPISITVKAGEALEELQATEMAALGRVAPSLVMMRTGAFTQPYLRGVGKRSTLGVENSVATYVDGVYFASSIGALLDLRGVAQVEILNGPQGTLFGRNSPGGVIQIITRDPSPEPSGEVELHGGDYGYGRGDAYLTAGSDLLAANLAVSLSRNDGYGVNHFTGRSDQGEVDHSLVMRSKWIWRPAEAVRVVLAADYQDVDQDFSQRPLEGFPVIGDPRVSGFRDGDQDASNRHHFRYGGASIKAEAEVGNLTFMSLSAARRMYARYANDLDQGPHALFSGAPTADQRQFSQEFQLQSSDLARVRWLAGLYYIHIEERYEPTTFGYGGSYSAQLGGRIAQTLFDIGRVSSYAAYGEAIWPVRAKVRLTTGLRYTMEDRSVSARGERLFDNPPFIRPIPGLPLTTQEPFRSSKTFRNWTWRASLDFDLSDTAMGYLSASHGFQSGGWNLQTPQAPAFAPEQLTAFEGGLKYSARSGRFSADASAFYYDYSDLQVSAFTPLGSMTTNAASADIYGVALQLDAELAARTSMTFGAQFLEARFNRFPNATCTDYSDSALARYAPVSCDVTGNRLPFAPKFKFNGSLSHEIPLGRDGSLVLSGNLAHNSGYFSEADNVVRQKAFSVLDISVKWNPGPRSPSVRLWAMNLGDTEYYDSLVTFPTMGVLQRPAAPRRFGVSIAYQFF